MAAPALFSLLNGRCFLSRILSLREHLASTFYYCKTHIGTIGQTKSRSKDVALKNSFSSFNTQLDRF